MNLQFSTIFLVLFTILSILLAIALCKWLLAHFGDHKNKQKTINDFTQSLGLDDESPVETNAQSDQYQSEMSATGNKLDIGGYNNSTSHNEQDPDQHDSTKFSDQAPTSINEPSDPDISTENTPLDGNDNNERRKSIRRQTERQAHELSNRLIKDELQDAQSSYNAIKDEHNLVGTETDEFFTTINAYTSESNESYFKKSERSQAERSTIEQQEMLIVRQIEKIREQIVVIDKLSAQIKNQESTKKALTNRIFESSKINSLTKTIDDKDRQISKLRDDITALHNSGKIAKSNKSEAATEELSIGVAGSLQIQKLLGNLKIKHARVVELEAQLSTLNTNHTDLAIKSDKWAIKIRKLESELNKRDSTINSLEKQAKSFKDSEEKFNNSSQQQENLHGEPENGSNRNSLIEDRTSSEQQSYPLLRKELGSTDAESQSAVGQTTDRQSHVSKQQLNAIENQNAKLEHDVETLTTQIKELPIVKSQLAEREHRIEELEKQLSDTQAFDQNNTELEALYKDLEKNDAKISSLENRLQESATQNDSLSEEKSLTKKQLDSLNERIGQLESTEKKLQAEIDKNTEVTSELKLKVGKEAQLDIELLRYRTENSALQTKLEEAIRENEKLTAMTTRVQSSANRIELINPSITGQQKRASNIISINAANQSKHSKNRRTSKTFAPCDDLKKIYGIGKKIEKILHKSGYTTYEQIADLSRDDVASLAPKLGSLHSRIKRDGWKKSARVLANQKRRNAA